MIIWVWKGWGCLVPPQKPHHSIFILFIFLSFFNEKSWNFYQSALQSMSSCHLLRSFQLLVMGKKIIYNSIFIKQNVFLFSTETGKIKNYLLIAGPNQKSVVNLLMHINRFIFKGWRIRNPLWWWASWWRWSPAGGGRRGGHRGGGGKSAEWRHCWRE